MPNGWIVTFLLLLPNALFLFLAPRNVPVETDGRRQFKMQVLETVERFGQIGCFALPFFYNFHFETLGDKLALAFFCLFMAIYFTGWTRYIQQGREFRWLFAPLLGIPLPMAVMPVMALIAVAVNFRAWLLAAAALILGFGHIPVSWLEWQRCQK